MRGLQITLLVVGAIIAGMLLYVLVERAREKK